MKKLFLSAVLFFTVQWLPAQLAANLVLSPNPPGTITDWADKKETLSLVVINQSGAPARFIVKAEFKLTDGTVIGSADLAKARVFNLQAASLVLNAADIIPFDIVTFTGKYKTSLDKTGKLPAGTYMFCIRLVAPGSFQPVSEERCRVFNIASLQLAIPVMPFNEQVLNTGAAQTAVTFRWTPVTPSTSFPVTYRLLVFEVNNNQTPMQAVRSNMPVLNKDITGTTQFIWQPQGMINTSESNQHEQIKTDSVAVTRQKTFVWTLQCLDNLGRPISDGNVNSDGISEPIIFFVGKEVDKLKEEIKKLNKKE